MLLVTAQEKCRASCPRHFLSAAHGPGQYAGEEAKKKTLRKRFALGHLLCRKKRNNE
jgi:hypothetical protein